jgi:hypothetical protein
MLSIGIAPGRPPLAGVTGLEAATEADVPVDDPVECLPAPGRSCLTGGAPYAARRTQGALLAGELLAQDVRVAVVLSELAQHVEVHPAQRERAAPVAVDEVVQAQG